MEKYPTNPKNYSTGSNPTKTYDLMRPIC